jgi:N4-gp56 family major capsid protein
MCDAKDGTMDGYGKELHAGDNFHWDVFSDVATQGTTLTETTTMPETRFTIVQGTLTVTEYGNSVPYTGKLDDLSLLPVKEIVHRVLKNDAKKAFDLDAHAQFDLTPLIAQPTAGTDTAAVTIVEDGVSTNTVTVAMNKEHVKSIIDAMKERNIEPFLGDDYMSLAHPSTYRNFKNDLEGIHQYVDAGFQMILYGEIGRYEGTRFVEQTNVAKETVNSTATNWAFFFGADTVAEAICIPEEMRGKIPTDYGRSKGVAWYYLGGFGLAHTTAMGVAQARIVKWETL